MKNQPPRLAALALREVRRFAAIAAARAGRKPESIRTAPSFRPLTEAETEALLGVELLAALSDAHRRA